MTDRYLYTLSIPSAAQVQNRRQAQRNLATHGLLNSGSGSVESLSIAPNEYLLRGGYRGKYSQLMAAEIEELADANDIEAVPFVSQAGQQADDGYYSVQDANTHQPVPQLSGLSGFDVTLKRIGTRESKRRSVKATPHPAGNDFGSEQTALVGIPAAASDVWWYNGETEATEAPSVVETRSAELGDIEVYDALYSSFDAPALVYDLPYRQAGKVDVTVWDDHDRSKLDGDGVNSWQWVFSTAHEFTGAARLDNGLVRVQLDDTLAVEEWDPDAEYEHNGTTVTGLWTEVALGDSTWTLDGWSLRRISPERVDAQVRFRDSSQQETVFTLDLRLERGHQYPQWTLPDSAGDDTTVPSDLRTLLDQVAGESIVTAKAEQLLVDRSKLEE